MAQTAITKVFVNFESKKLYHWDPELLPQTAKWTEPGCLAPNQEKG